jgi:hypothetical protein
MRQGVDYTISNANIAFLSPRAPSSGDILVASYRVGVSLSGVTFMDSEVPTGNIDGTNLAFALAATPTPAASLVLYRNGLRMKVNLDYSLSGRIVIFPAALVPHAGDSLIASYRATH